MTQTLTTDELRQIAETDHVQCGDAAAMARELLANREAQPVWIDAEVHGAIQDILQGRMFGAGRYVTLNRNQAPNGFKQRMPIYTAPPAPAVPRVTAIPEAATLTNINQLCPLDTNLSQIDFATGWNDCRQYAITNDGVPPVAQGWHSAAQGWNACRAAMLAQPQIEPQNIPNNIPDGLAAAVNRLLDSDGSRGCFSAVRSYDAREEIERLLAQPVSQGYKLPDGFKLMPIEMTDEIGEAIALEARCCGGIALCIYEAALAAAPEGGNG